MSSSISPKPEQPTGQLETPPNVSVQRSPDQLVIILRHRNSTAWSMLAIAIFWDLIMGIIISVQLSDGGPVSLLALFFTAVGLLLTYYSLVLIFNATTITATREAIRVGQGPIPWTGNVRVPVDQINRLEREEVESPSKERYYHFFRLSALMKDGSRVRFLGSLPVPQLPDFIRAELRGFLNL